MTRAQIEVTECGFKIKFGKSVPSDIRKGHRQHKSGAGIHGMRKKVRVRGNQAKRMWLDNEE